MAQITITNLTSGSLSLDIGLDDGTSIRENLPQGGSIDVGDRAEVDELNKNAQVQALIAAGTISVTHQAEAGDVAEEVKLNTYAYLGAPVLADVDRIAAALDPIADGAMTIIAQPDVPRNVTVTVTDANDSASGNITIVGVDAQGRAVTEYFAFGGGTKVFAGTKIFATVTSATIADTAGAAAGDTISVGVGDVIGLPSDISATTAVKLASLGAVPVTPDAIAVGTSTSGVDVNGATYDGTKIMTVSYNTGE